MGEKLNFEVRENKAKQGIEVAFSRKPEGAETEALLTLKRLGFSWGGRKRPYWYRKAWGLSAHTIYDQIETTLAALDPDIIGRDPDGTLRLEVVSKSPGRIVYRDTQTTEHVKLPLEVEETPPVPPAGRSLVF